MNFVQVVLFIHLVNLIHSFGNLFPSMVLPNMGHIYNSFDSYGRCR